MTSPPLTFETVNSSSSSVGASETSAAHPVAQAARSIKQMPTRWPTAFVAAPATTVTLTFTLSRTDAPFHTIYDSFGNHVFSSHTRYTYTGRERDADTGLMYNRARSYDPQLGRFISEDPIGFGGGDINLYGYVWQSPLRLRDPLGLDGGWAPSDIADWADPRIEAVRRWLEPNPDSINWNTLINYGGNTWHGFVDLLRVGRGLGRYLNGCGDGFDVLHDVGRASGIALILAGTA